MILGCRREWLVFGSKQRSGIARPHLFLAELHRHLAFVRGLGLRCRRGALLRQMLLDRALQGRRLDGRRGRTELGDEGVVVETGIEVGRHGVGESGLAAVHGDLGAATRLGLGLEVAQVDVELHPGAATTGAFLRGAGGGEVEHDLPVLGGHGDATGFQGAGDVHQSGDAVEVGDTVPAVGAEAHVVVAGLGGRVAALDADAEGLRDFVGPVHEGNGGGAIDGDEEDLPARDELEGLDGHDVFSDGECLVGWTGSARECAQSKGGALPRPSFLVLLLGFERHQVGVDLLLQLTVPDELEGAPAHEPEAHEDEQHGEGDEQGQLDEVGAEVPDDGSDDAGTDDEGSDASNELGGLDLDARRSGLAVGNRLVAANVFDHTVLAGAAVDPDLGFGGLSLGLRRRLGGGLGVGSCGHDGALHRW